MTPTWTLHAKGADLNTKPFRELPNVWWAAPDKRNHEASQKKLQTIYEANQDIRCGCSGARMFVRYLQTGRYTIVNHPVEGRHNKQCKFYTDISGEISHREYGGEAEFKEILTFCYHADINSTISTEQNVEHYSSDMSKQKQQSKLLRLMNQLCSEAFMNTYTKPLQKFPFNKSKAELRIFARLRESATNIKFGSSTLDHYIYYGKHGESYAQNALKSKQWKGAGRRHVFLIEMVDTIEENYSELIMDGEHAFYERVIRPGFKGTSGPYLVLSSVVEEDGGLFRHTACVKPIVSREVPMLVDSNYERRMAEALIYNINEYTDRSKRDYWSLQKPLIPKPSNSGEQVLPDFILTHKVDGKQKYREIIEVMGTDNQDYQARKNRLIPQMKEKFYSKELVEIKAYIPGRLESYADRLRAYMMNKQ